MPTSGPSLFSMSPKQASLSEKSIGSFPLAAAHPLTVLSWPEALHASGSRRTCVMHISRNACSLVALPDLPELAQAVRHGVPGTPRQSPHYAKWHGAANHPAKEVRDSWHQWRIVPPH